MDITLRENINDQILENININDGFGELTLEEMREFMGVPVQINVNVDIHGKYVVFFFFIMEF